MCGIFGIIHFNDKPIDTFKAEEAAKSLSHRGPDDYGTFLSESGNAFFCHYRLSIIELSKLGHQPMSTEDGRYIILYNGEIYNYKSLCHSGPALPALSADRPAGRLDPESSSDTRTLLNLFANEGLSSLNNLRGMFSFAVWDEKEKSLFASRDRFGIKPFYYLINKDEFIFASELKAIKKYKTNLTNSEEAIDAFLKTGSVPAPLTIYEEVKSLMPGHYIRINSSGKSEITQYWTFADVINTGNSHPELFSGYSSSLRSRLGGRSNLNYNNEAKQSIRNSLLDCITAHMVSDVEVGAFLSGGIDSSAVVSLMKQAGQEKIRTVSVTFPGSKLDESFYAKKAAEKYGVSHTEYPLTEDEVMNDIEKFFEAVDQPTIDGLNTYFVSKAAASLGLKVVISGLGGDELFGGYSTFRYIPFIETLSGIPLSGFVSKIAAPFVKPFVKPKANEYLKHSSGADASYKLFRGLFTSEELKQLGINSHAPMQSSSHASMLSSNHASFSSLQYISFLESTNYMSNQLLRDSDVFSMCHSLELRVPFVDHKLYSVVLKYIDRGYDKNKPKRMLTDAVGDLPEEIINRKKMGFTFPFDEWMRKGKLGKIVKESISSQVGNFNIKGVQKLIKDFDKGKVHWSRLWALFVLSRMKIA